MKLNAILIALFATAAYAQDGRPSKEQMMALKEEMRNAKVRAVCLLSFSKLA